MLGALLSTLPEFHYPRLGLLCGARILDHTFRFYYERLGSKASAPHIVWPGVYIPFGQPSLSNDEG